MIVTFAWKRQMWQIAFVYINRNISTYFAIIHIRSINFSCNIIDIRDLYI